MRIRGLRKGNETRYGSRGHLQAVPARDGEEGDSMWKRELGNSVSQCEVLLKALTQFAYGGTPGSPHVEDAPAALAIAEALHQHTGEIVTELGQQMKSESSQRERATS